jgi:hypothetical protein
MGGGSISNPAISGVDRFYRAKGATLRSARTTYPSGLYVLDVARVPGLTSPMEAWC